MLLLWTSKKQNLLRLKLRRSCVIYIYIYGCLDNYIYIHTLILGVCVYICMYIYIFTNSWLDVTILRSCSCSRKTGLMLVRLKLQILMERRLFNLMYIDKYPWMIYIYIYIYIYISLHTCICICIHIHVWKTKNICINTYV